MSVNKHLYIASHVTAKFVECQMISNDSSPRNHAKYIAITLTTLHKFECQCLYGYQRVDSINDDERMDRSTLHGYPSGNWSEIACCSL